MSGLRNLRKLLGMPPDICISCFEAIMELGMSLKRFQRLMEKRALQIKDKANGFYTRNVDTSLGSFQNVKVPRLQLFLARWQDQQSRSRGTIRLFQAHLDQTLTYLQLPIHMHCWFRTTNYLERLFRNVCSRTKPITAFDQPCHLERLVIGSILQLDWIKLPWNLQPLFTAHNYFSFLKTLRRQESC